MIDKIEIPFLKINLSYVKLLVILRDIKTFMMFPILICFPSKICMFVYTEEVVGSLMFYELLKDLNKIMGKWNVVKLCKYSVQSINSNKIKMNIKSYLCACSF